MFDWDAIDVDNAKLNELLLKKLDEIYYEGCRRKNAVSGEALKRCGDIDAETRRQMDQIGAARDAAILELVHAYFDAKTDRFFSHRHETAQNVGSDLVAVGQLKNTHSTRCLH